MDLFVLCVSPAVVKALRAQSLQRWKSCLIRAPESPSAIPAAKEGREAVCALRPPRAPRGGPVSQPLPASHSSHHKAAHLSSLCLGAVYLCPPPSVWWPHDDMELMPPPSPGQLRSPDPHPSVSSDRSSRRQAPCSLWKSRAPASSPPFASSVDTYVGLPCCYSKTEVENTPCSRTFTDFP